ncbi:MAG: RHS repeat-associated core domain-containing protein [Paracoccaceae bacterium]
MRRLHNGTPVSVLSILHYDGLGSVRAVTNAPGLKSETSSYRPYGEPSEGVWTALLNEAKGYIGERYDADAGLQYLNARYYDPRLGMFVQSDWWEVMQEGVGTNRYSYAFGDPVNGKDPTGHQNYSTDSRFNPGRTLGDLIKDLFGGRIAGRSDVDLAANAKGTAERMKADIKAAAASAVRTAVDLSPLGAARDLVGSARAGSAGGAALAAAGLIPGERIVGGFLGRVASALTRKAPSVKDIAKVVSDAPKRTTLRPGPFAKESIPGHMGKPTATEQQQINDIFKEHGCHTCGTKDPGTKSGNAIVDHQPPQALDETKEFYPHCIDCMRRQGGETLQELLRRA